MRNIHLFEHHPCDITLSKEEVILLWRNFKNKIDIYPNLEGDSYKIIPKQYVGNIILNDTHIRIEPSKIDTDCLFWMLTYAYNLADFREMQYFYEENPNLFEFIVKIANKKIHDLCRSGILKSYNNQQDNLKYLRGRLLIQENIYNSRSLNSCLSCEFQEFNSDIFENIILKYTLFLLTHKKYVDNTTTNLIRKNLSYFKEVSLKEIKSNQIDNVLYNRLNLSYKPLLNLCKLFIDGLSISDKEGGIEFSSFLLDMNRLFETFISEYLKSHLTDDKSITISTQETYHLSTDRRVKTRPDIIIKQDNIPKLVLDTKYKKIKSESSVNRSDIHQMIAFCKSTGVKKAYLIYPKGEDIETEFEIMRDNIIVGVKTVDLNGNREKVEDNLKSFVNWVNDIIIK